MLLISFQFNEMPCELIYSSLKTTEGDIVDCYKVSKLYGQDDTVLKEMVCIYNQQTKQIIFIIGHFVMDLMCLTGGM